MHKAITNQSKRLCLPKNTRPNTVIQNTSKTAIDLFLQPFFKVKLWSKLPKMSQILFLDTPGDVSNLMLKKKISVKNGIIWNFFDFFWQVITYPKSGQKIDCSRPNPLPSSSKFCQDFKNGQLFAVDPVALVENRDFLREGGVKNQQYLNKS